MNKTPPPAPPPDQAKRELALDPARSILVQAPAGSGKTDLLTRRFLRLLAQVDEPGEIVAITFTIAAAAEMRHRILAELEKAAAQAPSPTCADKFSMSALAHRALERSNALGWKLIDLPSQLRISTIDSFCRDLALQQPLLSGLGGGLDIAVQPNDLYRCAARHTLEQIGEPGSEVAKAAEELLNWRDNNWQELEDLLVVMLSQRDRWMHGFVLSHNPDWEALRHRLERPFVNAIRAALHQVSGLLNEVHGATHEALALARFACSQPLGERHRELAELAEFPSAPFFTPDQLDEAHQALLRLADLLLTSGGTFRKAIDKNLGFPSTAKPEKARLAALIASLAAVPGLESTLAALRELPPARYTDDDWQIVRACFTLLRHAAAHLKVVFAEAAAVDFIEVAQIAESVLKSEDGFPTDAAQAVADGIHHLLVDEFQDTSRRQHQLLAALIAAWPDRQGRTLFAVGDPMQSIYGFREADAELFARVKKIGMEIPNAEPLSLDFVQLSANFRTTPPLVDKLNEAFAKVFAIDDASGVTFSSAAPAREKQSGSDLYFNLYINFIPQITKHNILSPEEQPATEDLQALQVAQIVDLIRSHQSSMEEAPAAGQKYRIAVLARTRASLAPIAHALREAAIPFRAVDLEKLAARPEVLDALALARALLNPQDRLSWLGVLRAPWCGLTLTDLHILISADESAVLARPIPDLLAERLPLLSEAGQGAVKRVLSGIALVPLLHASLPTASLGTGLQQIWLALGAADCCDATARANLDLLWACLDRLPEGEQDLLGPALNAALDKLTALPDPKASSDCGVQLMTIHKSKGLEFEVVIVPDLQARTAGGSRKLLSWLERGLNPEPDSEPAPTAEITEFLIAPLQPKGEDRGKSKSWVDQVFQEREEQETRRILYVAATRAREQLHLFARPTYKVDAAGEFNLPTPSVGLLSTAWPALEEEIAARFEEWKASSPAATMDKSATEDVEIASIAAADSGNLFLMPSPRLPPVKPTLLRRLPPDYRPSPRNQGLGAPSFPRHFAETVGDHETPPGAPDLASDALDIMRYSRHEGGLPSRALGTAVHALLEELARLRVTVDWQTAQASIRQHEPRIAAQVRAAGIAPHQAARIAANALHIALTAAQNETGQWILSPHPEAASEVRWTGVVTSGLVNVRADRVFRAGLTPKSEDDSAWWIVDYKTAHADNLDPTAALPQMRPLFAPQLETYARVLRNLHGSDATIRVGLYYPRMSQFDWWQFE